MCKELHYTEESFWFNLKVKFLAFDLFVHFFFNEAPRSTETEDRNICERCQRVQRLPFVYNNGMNCISKEPLCMIYNVCKIYKFTFSTNSFCTHARVLWVNRETSMCLCRYTFQMKMSVNVCVRWYKISQIIHVQLHTTNSTRLLSLMLDCTRAFSLSLPLLSISVTLLFLLSFIQYFSTRNTLIPFRFHSFLFGKGLIYYAY